MKFLIIVISSFLIISCGSNIEKSREQKQKETDSQFLSVSEVDTRSSDGKTIKFNTGYTIIVEQEINENCGFENIEGLDIVFIKPLVHKVVKENMTRTLKSKINSLDNDILEKEINERIKTGGLFIDGKQIKCKVSVALFKITQR